MSHDHLICCPIRTKTLHSGLRHLSDEVQKRNWNLKVSGDVESLMDALDILDIKPDGSTSERLTIAIPHLSACLTMELSCGHPPLFPQEWKADKVTYQPHWKKPYTKIQPLSLGAPW